MITSTFPITFDFPLEAGNRSIAVTADVEVHHSMTHYTIRNFRTGTNHNQQVLPDITIRKLNGRWVHTDSEKETRLSILVGNAIDRSEHT